MVLTALIFGLLGSFHCVGMCGPIAFLLPVDRKSNTKKALQISLYHVGRLISYGIIGLLFGLVGKGLNLFGIQQKLTIIIGVVMIAAVFFAQFVRKQSWLSKITYRFVSKVKSTLGVQLKKRTPDTFFTIGFLNGLLPCGLVYMAVLGAIGSGNALSGAAYMVLFGVGTIPLMTTAVYMGNFLSGKVRQHIKKSIPVFLVIIGLLFVVRGLGLGIPYVSPKPMTNEVSNNYECNQSTAVEADADFSLKNRNNEIN